METQDNMYEEVTLEMIQQIDRGVDRGTTVNDSPKETKKKNEKETLCDVEYGLPQLSFDEFLASGPNDVIGLRDFLFYLLNERRTPENLQFALFLSYYKTVFDKLKKEHCKGVSQPWTGPVEKPRHESRHVTVTIPADIRMGRKNSRQTLRSTFPSQTTIGATSVDITDVELSEMNLIESREADGPEDLEAADPQGSSRSRRSVITPWESVQPNQTEGNFTNDSHNRRTSLVAPWERQDSVPNIAENSRSTSPETYAVYEGNGILTHLLKCALRTYFGAGSTGTREINISATQKDQILLAISQSNHPSVFDPISNSIEKIVTTQHIPEFYNWLTVEKPQFGSYAQIYTRARKLNIRMDLLMGCYLILLGLATVVVLLLSSCPQPWSIIGAILVAFGASIAACACWRISFVEWLFFHHELKPWEQMQRTPDGWKQWDMSDEHLEVFDGPTLKDMDDKILSMWEDDVFYFRICPTPRNIWGKCKVWYKLVWLGLLAGIVVGICGMVIKMPCLIGKCGV